MINWLLSPMTRLDWLAVLATTIGLSWLFTTPLFANVITKWTIKRMNSAFENFDDLFDADDEEDGLR